MLRANKMFYHLFYQFLYNSQGTSSFFRLFRYISFRAAYATLTSLIIAFFLGPLVIRALKREKVTANIREEYLQNHTPKNKTPTMGGMIILSALLISTLLWARLDNQFILLILFSVASMGLLGFFDDYLKLIRHKPEGLVAKYKLIGQTILATIIACYLYYYPVSLRYATSLNLPFFAEPPINLGWFYIPFMVLVIVGASNAVNLTDGLDGLAIGALIFTAIAYAAISYISGNYKLAAYLRMIYIGGSGELTIFLGALIGAGVGFLWFNAYPAQVFMGDTGSLALGGALGTMACLLKQEILLIIAGGLFVIEALSVLIQIASYKLTGKRVFAMAPLHHHFEKKGWPEPKITVRFLILAGIFTLISLSTLKLR